MARGELAQRIATTIGDPSSSGPNRTLTDPRPCCERSPHCRHSPQPQNQMVGEFTDCGQSTISLRLRQRLVQGSRSKTFRSRRLSERFATTSLLHMTILTWCMVEEARFVFDSVTAFLRFSTECSGLSPSCAGVHRNDGPKADHAPTFNMDHSGGAAQRRWRQHMPKAFAQGTA